MKTQNKFTRTLSIAGCVVAFGLVFISILYNLSSADRPTSENTGNGGDQVIPVVASPIQSRTFEQRLQVQGNVAARDIAMVPVKIAATLESIYVDEGDPVTAGVTKLFKTDSVTLEKTLEVQKQSLAVAKCGLLEKEAGLERTKADLHKAQLDYERFKKLLEDKTVSADEFEQTESRYKQAKASYKHARALVALAIETQAQAEATLGIARKKLADSLVYAPISGVVSQRFQEPGEMGDINKPVMRLEDPSFLEVIAHLPEQYYTRLKPGETKMHLMVNGIKIKDKIVSYRSPVIDSRLRTFEIKAFIQDPPEGVVPGAMAEIDISLRQREGLGVPVDAVVKQEENNVVFVVADGKAHMIKVKTGLESNGWVEILESSLKMNTLVVTQGQFLLKEGTRVDIKEVSA